MKKFLVLIILVSTGWTSSSSAQNIWEYNPSYAQTVDVNGAPEECTIGVASGKATADGRPLVWKTRDTSPNDQEAYFVTTGKYKFVNISTNGNSNSMSCGVNEKGFAIVNSDALDLPGSGGQNLSLMYIVLGKCATDEEFEHYLDSTNITGRTGISSNFAVIDSTGAAAVYETVNNQYWKFDANDTTQAPDGYIVRTNFTVHGGGNLGLPNYNRSRTLLGDFFSGDSLNYRNIIRYQMRDFSDANSNPIPVPYQDFWNPDLPFGYFDTRNSICRFCNVSAAVIQGVLPDETGKLSTMWGMLSDPATSISVPYWPVSQTPIVANKPNSTPLCKVGNAIHSSIYSNTLIHEGIRSYIDSYKLRDETGGGLWARIFPAEDSIFNAAEIMLEKWRNDTLIVEEMEVAETSFAEYALSILQSSYNDIISSNYPIVVLNNLNIYPNPTNNQLTIETEYPDHYSINITTLNGQLIFHTEMEGTFHQIDLSTFQKGVYFITIRSEDFVTTKKIIKQ